MRLSYPNEPASLDRLESDLADFSARQKVEPKAHSALQLCLDEALSNVIAHAFEPGERHTIELELLADTHGVTATLVDSGKPFDPLREALARNPLKAGAGESSAAEATEDEHGPGMGVFLMRRLLDELHYVRQDGRNVLRLHKRFEASGNGTHPKQVAKG